MADFPIVYIRGYAMTPSQVEDAFNMPYYGFNLGSTQVKLAKDEKLVMRLFESPVVRLIKEEEYVDSLNKFVDSANRPMANSVPAANPKVDWHKTLWIFRFYDAESKLLGGRRVEIEDYAEQLAVFLDDVRKACGSPPEFTVNLIAHSMGGLISRCYLQHTPLFRRRDLRAVKPVPVNKLFTYGTRHRGITFRQGLGWVEDVGNLLGIYGVDTFGEPRMREFLSLPSGDLHIYRPARGGPPLERIFCLVGTNYQDYPDWATKHAVGPGSDGLITVNDAYVKGAPRAYIHSAHHGPFGMVNSEEGYQNLTRFLFGDVRYEALLEPLEVIREQPGLGEGDALDYLEINVDVVIRGLPTYIHTRRELDQSAIIVKMVRKRDGTGYRQKDTRATHLFTGYLRQRKKMPGKDPFLRGAIQLRIMPHYLHKGWVRLSRFEGESIFNDRLHLGVRRDVRPPVIQSRWGLVSSVAKGKAPEPDGTYLFPLPPGSAKFVRSKGIRLRTSPGK